MITRDDVLLAEAYISAYKKNVDVPEENVTDSAPDTDGAVEMHAEPVVVSLGGEEAGCSCQDHETVEEHENEETRMAKTNLFTLFTDAKMLHDLICAGEDLEPWMLQKIAVASEGVCSVTKVVRYMAARDGVL
jgi:hypothetical protein